MAKSGARYVVHPAMFGNHPILFVICLILPLLWPVFLIWWVVVLGTTLTVTEHATTLRRGILSKHTNEVAHQDVRQLQVSQGMVQRLLGVGTVAVSSAGHAGLEIVVTGIPAPQRVRELIDSRRHGGEGPFEPPVPPKASALGVVVGVIGALLGGIIAISIATGSNGADEAAPDPRPAPKQTSVVAPRPAPPQSDAAAVVQSDAAPPPERKAPAPKPKPTTVEQGMTPEDVTAILGEPIGKSKRTIGGAEKEIWAYSTKGTVTFSGGVVERYVR